MRKEKYKITEKWLLNNNWDVGSMTVEAAFIMPLSLIVILTLLALCFHMHNQAWYTAAAGEAIISGSTYAVRKNGNYKAVMEDKLNRIKAGSGFPGSAKKVEDYSTDQAMMVSALSSTKVILSRGRFQMQVTEDTKVIKPVVLIREIQALELLKE